MTINVELALQIAHTHGQAGQAAAAEAIYRQVLARQPDHAEALHRLGVLAAGMGRDEEAAELIGNAIGHAPGRADFHSDLGLIAWRLSRLDEAIVHSQRALALRPDMAEAHNNLGNALMGKGRCAEAAGCYQRAVTLRPGFAEAHSNLGSALGEMDRFDEAIECIRRALVLKPDSAEGHLKLGVAYFHKAMFGPALECYRKAVACRTDFAAAHWNLALLLLRLGRYEEGWKEYEWRWLSPTHAAPRRDFSALQWDGSPMHGLTLVLHTEQGFGDTIQFLRYVPLARAQAGAARVIIECEPTLSRLVAGSGIGKAEVVERSAALPSFDRHLPLPSLPLVLEQFEPLPMARPYLHADPALRARWRERLGPTSTFRVGVAWAGSPAHAEDRRRSIALDSLRPLLRVPGVSFFNLQIEPGAAPHPGLIDFTVHLTDFAETAALIAELDLIISVDTAAAHLAGALGRPVWTLLAFVPDWRWGADREDSPWYPTMRLFRQSTAGDWDSVIARVAGELIGACARGGQQLSRALFS